MENNKVRKILSENLQELMNDKNIDQRELAEAIGVSQPTVSIGFNKLNIHELKEFNNLQITSMYRNQELLNQKKIYIKKQLLLILIRRD